MGVNILVIQELYLLLIPPTPCIIQLLKGNIGMMQPLTFTETHMQINFEMQVCILPSHPTEAI